MGGIETYMRKMAALLPAVCEKDSVLLIANSLQAGLIESKGEACLVDLAQPWISLCRMGEAFTPWSARSIEQRIERFEPDVILHPFQSMFPMRSRAPSVLLVADLQYLYFPEYFSPFNKAFRKCSYLQSIRRCDKIISISRMTAAHLVENNLAPMEKIEVIPLGFESVKSIDRPARPVSGPYLYFPAASFPHKGHEALIRSFAALKREGLIRHKLVLSGMRNAYWKKIRKCIQDEGINDQVLDLGFVDYKTVSALYTHCEAVVFPSEFEGFGIPVLEAVEYEKPVICSRLKIFDELGVPAEAQIDYQDASQLLQAIRNNASTKLLQSPVSWEDVARRTAAVLSKVARLNHYTS